MTHADSTQREMLISGLRGLADFLESDPEMPAASYPIVYTFPPKGDWALMCAEVDAIAARLGVTASETCGHYVATRSFGPVSYRAVAIPQAARNDRDEEAE